MDQPQVSSRETSEILSLSKSTLDKKVEGDFVEFGCYKGETSVLLGKLLQSALYRPLKKSLWLYDSFAGLPEKTLEDASPAGINFKQGELLVTKREVLEKLRRSNLDLKAIRIKKAFFSDLSPETDLPKAIAFVFLDGDLYSSIKTSLKLVCPKLTNGALVVVHDYNNPELPGATKAVDEFLRERPDFSLRVHFSLAILTARSH